MSFIDTYLEKYRLDQIPDKVKDKLELLEEEMKDKSQSPNFSDCLSKFGPQIADLVERLSKQIDNLHVGSFKEALNLFRFVKSVAFEVYQIMEGLEECAIPDGLTPEEEKAAKIDLGTDLTYFVWVTIDPLKNVFNGLPFKKTLEKWLVRWLSHMSIEFTMDFLEANTVGQTDSVFIVKSDASLPHFKAIK